MSPPAERDDVFRRQSIEMEDAKQTEAEVFVEQDLHDARRAADAGAQRRERCSSEPLEPGRSSGSTPSLRSRPSRPLQALRLPWPRRCACPRCRASRTERRIHRNTRKDFHNRDSNTADRSISVIGEPPALWSAHPGGRSHACGRFKPRGKCVWKSAAAGSRLGRRSARAA
jgi:hypothetical protein